MEDDPLYVYAPPSPPAAFDEDKFDYNNKHCRDPIWAALFLLHLSGIVTCAAVFG